MIAAAWGGISGLEGIAGLVPNQTLPREAFMKQFGEAMGAWAVTERELSTVFALATGMKPEMAIQIFYSARSFKGRYDMFKSALIVAALPEDTKTCIRLILTRMNKYNECRTALAHNIPEQIDPKRMALIEGSAQFQRDEIKASARAKAITLETMHIISDNFNSLSNVVLDFWTEFLVQQPSLDTLRARLAQLPIDARSKDPPPPASPQKRQRQAPRD